MSRITRWCDALQPLAWARRVSASPVHTVVEQPLECLQLVLAHRENHYSVVLIVGDQNISLFIDRDAEGSI